MNRRLALVVALLCLALPAARPVRAQPCLIFVHGLQPNTNTYTSYTAARDYWTNAGLLGLGASDFIETATKSFATPYYVVGYNGTKRYSDAQAAGEVATEIVNATNGGNDGGGNHCEETYAEGGTFWVIAHSMGGAVMDYILGNDDPSDPNYNAVGSFDDVAERISQVITVSGAHRGAESADAACGASTFLCNALGTVLGLFAGGCSDGANYLRSADSVQVRTYSSAPAKDILLIAGFQGLPTTGGCLSGSDDGVVQYASMFACGGSASIGYDNTTVCNNSFKQESSGFRNLDAGDETHLSINTDSDRDERRAVPDGYWQCGGSACAPNTQVQTAMSSAQFISTLY